MKRLCLLLLLAGCGLPDGIDLNSMNRSIDPCQDFYQYACGGFIARNPVGSDGAGISRLAGAFFATEKAERDLINDMMTKAPPGRTANRVRAYYGSCSAGAASVDKKPLTDLLAQIDAVLDADGLARAVAAIHDVSGSALFSFGPDRDLLSPLDVIAFAGEGGLGLPDRTYYVDAPSATVLPAYRNHIKALSGQVGVTDAKLADAVIAVETSLATATLTPVQRRDPLAVYHLEPLTQLRQTLSHFSLDAYLQAERAPPFDSLNVAEPAFFDALDLLLTNTSLDDLKRYLRWRAIEAFAGALDDNAVREEYFFHAGQFYGFTTPLPRGEYCLRLTVGALPWSMSELYTAGISGVKEPAQRLVDRLREALRQDLQSVSWLDDPTRAAALDKLAGMRAGVFGPDDYASYETDVDLPSGSFPAALATLGIAGRAQAIQQIGRPDLTDWFMAPINVNASYSASVNTINLPAAILQQPMFDARFADVVNFGAIGTVIGHELTHGFDDQGRKFGRDGALGDMWTDSVKEQFDARAQCLVDQYSAVQGAPGVFIDGQLTLGENIADVGGVKLAYAALSPGDGKMGDFNEKQVFFIAFAQARCSNVRPAALANQLRTDPHSPDSARVNVVLKDVPEFAEAFGCAAGTQLGPPPTCEVW